MGRKFDARLPGMTNEELYAVDEATLDKTSKTALAGEKEKRERADSATERVEEKTERRRDNRITWGIAILAVVAVVLVAVFG